VDANSPIQVLGDDGKLRYDVLVAVQPSSLSPTQLQHLVAAISQGQPTVIFEDPFPYVFDVAGTSEDKQAPGGMFGMGGAPQPKGEAFRILWQTLGIAPVGEEELPGKLPGRVVCQAGNPYRRFGDMPPFGPFIFLRQENPGTFNPNEPSVKNLEELLVPFSGAIKEDSDNSDLTFMPLVNTSKDGTSTVDVDSMRLFSRSGDMESVLSQLKRTPEQSHTIAAWIKGKEKEGEQEDTKGKDEKTKPADKEGKDKKKEDAAPTAPAKSRPINVIYVADIDLLGNEWLQMRNAQGLDQFRWDNGPFVLNMVDAVAGDERFLAIRQRKPRYSTLQRIEEESRRALAYEDERAAEFQTKFNEEKTKLEDNVKKIEKKLTDLREANERRRNAGEQVDEAEQEAQEQIIALQLVKAQSDAVKATQELQRKHNKDLETIRRERDQTVRSVQNEYKLWSVAIPPIPPLLVGFIVFVRRRLREREGISKARMKY
jgi:ABC-2 type transport system permease protein